MLQIILMKSYPKQIPIFPLGGVIYFPKTNLPLNIFETRYLKLVNDCMKTNKLMGMVQMKKDGTEVYKIGCLGKINEFQKTDDGRIIINLIGITRFEIIKEIDSSKLYREFIVEYNKFQNDLKNENNEKMKEHDLELLFKKTKSFFKKNGLLLNWNEFKKLNLTQQINTLSMIAPVSNEEKQKLLETISVNDKSKTLSEIIEFYLYEKSINKKTIQ